MSTSTITRPGSGRAAWVLLGWAVVTLLLALLPEGVGGSARELNALVFLCAGPGCALMPLLLRSMTFSTAAVVAIGSSLGALILSSQVLLLVGFWRYWSVTAIMALLTVALAFLPSVRGRGSR